MNPWKGVEDENLRKHTITITDDLLRFLCNGIDDPTVKYNWTRLKSLYKEIKRRAVRDAKITKIEQND